MKQTVTAETQKQLESAWSEAFDFIPDSIFILDLNYCFIRVNKATVEYLETTKKALTGKKCYRYFHGSNHPTDNCPYEEMLRLHKPVIREIPIAGNHTLLVSIVPVLNTQGEIIGCIHTGKDITERKLTEQELQESEKRFRLIFEESPIGMAIIDTNQQFVKANKALFRMLRYTCEELDKIRFPDIICQEDREKIEQRMQLLHKGILKSFNLENRYLVKEQKIGWADFVVSIMDKTGDEPPYYLVRLQDISIRKQGEADLKNRSIELEAANKELEAFSYSVSHDLRAPLRSITGFCQILQEGYSNELDEKGRDSLQRIVNSAKDMRELIDNLLKFSRVTLTEMHKGQVDLSSLVNSILKGLKEIQPERKVEIEIEPKVIASGDTYLLQIMLGNLLDNAWKFTSQKPVGKINFGSQKKEGLNIYYIKDNGAGFSLENIQDRLFAPFQRFHKAEEFPGIGIGLATAQRIVTRHGGRIWAESKPEEGTTFYFTLGEFVTPKLEQGYQI